MTDEEIFKHYEFIIYPTSRLATVAPIHIEKAYREYTSLPDNARVFFSLARGFVELKPHQLELPACKTPEEYREVFDGILNIIERLEELKNIHEK